MTRLFRLTLLVLILLSAFTVSAQDDDTTDECSTELINIFHELKNAEADAQRENNTENLADIQAQIADIRAICGDLILDLPQKITSVEPSGGELTVHYPDGWITQDLFGSVVLTDSQETLYLDDRTLMPVGAVYVNVTVLTPDAVLSTITEGEASMPLNVLNSVFTSSLPEGFEIEDPVEETLNGRSAATIIMRGDNFQRARAFIVVVSVDDGFVVFVAGTNANETRFDDTVRQIAGAVEVTFTDSQNADDAVASNGVDVELTQSLSTTDSTGGMLTVSLPEDWIAQEFNGIVTLSNYPDSLTTNQEQLSSGQMVGSILVLPTEIISALGIGDNPTALAVLDTFRDATLSTDTETQFDFYERFSFTEDNREAALTSGTATDDTGTQNISFAMVKVNGGFIMLTFVAPVGEMTLYDDQIRAIAGSVEYEAGD